MIQSIIAFLSALPELVKVIRELNSKIEQMQVQNVNKEIEKRLSVLNENIKILKEAKNNEQIKRALDGIGSFDK